MCGRYRRTTREEELARIYRIRIPAQPALPISYNIAANQPALAMRLNPETEQLSIGQPDDFAHRRMVLSGPDHEIGDIRARDLETERG